MILDITEERIYELENTTVEFIRNQTQSEKLKYMEKQLSNTEQVKRLQCMSIRAPEEENRRTE